MNIVRLLYDIIVLYLSLHFLWYIVRQKKIWDQAGAALVLALLLLRLFHIK
ncbi:MAG: hypothetical protein JXE07_06040 [Candidatus Aminicenantes bacterium]|nr:hypothetical protein [Candidatus Aminicenantes bacterium]